MTTLDELHKTNPQKWEQLVHTNPYLFLVSNHNIQAQFPPNLIYILVPGCDNLDTLYVNIMRYGSKLKNTYIVLDFVDETVPQILRDIPPTIKITISNQALKTYINENRLHELNNFSVQYYFGHTSKVMFHLFRSKKYMLNIPDLSTQYTTYITYSSCL